VIFLYLGTFGMGDVKWASFDAEDAVLFFLRRRESLCVKLGFSGSRCEFIERRLIGIWQDV
jgi:hypothetical protein